MPTDLPYAAEAESSLGPEELKVSRATSQAPARQTPKVTKPVPDGLQTSASGLERNQELPGSNQRSTVDRGHVQAEGGRPPTTRA